MKKRLVLKKEIREGLQNILFFAICFGVIILCAVGLNALDEQTKKDAIERCGGIENIVEKHTKEGDVYYSCKVEK